MNRLDKQLEKIVREIDKFRKVKAELSARKEASTALEQIRKELWLSKTEFAGRLSVSKQQYDMITDSKYTSSYLARLLRKAKRLTDKR